MIVKHFSPIPSDGMPGDDFSAFNHENTFQPAFHEKVHFVKQMSNDHRIDISWSIKPMVLVCTRIEFTTEKFEALILCHMGFVSTSNFGRKMVLSSVKSRTYSTFEQNLYHALVYESGCRRLPSWNLLS